MKDYYALVVRDFIFPLSIRLRAGNYGDKLREAKRNQFLSREELRKLQFEKLGAMIRHAYYYVPYYRDWFTTAGITPEDIRNWADFEQLPILTKDVVRDHNRQFLSEKRRTPLRSYKTSGSTGKPLEVFTSEIAIAAEYACRFRAFHHWGVDVGDRAVFFVGGYRYTTYTGRKKTVRRLVYNPLKSMLFNRRELPVFNINEKDLEAQWRFLEKYRPKFMSGFPSSLHRLAKYVEEMDYDGGSLGVKLISVGGEVLYDFQLEALERVFHCPVANVYGSFEIGIAACSYPCGALHTNDDFVIVEVIKERPQDEFGQIIATRLDNWEFPLIRFNIEDLAPPLVEHRDCTLGLNFLKLERVVGREFDRIFLTNGQEIHGTFFTALLKRVSSIRQFQVNQRRPDCIEILAVIDEGMYTSDQEHLIKDRIHSLVGPLEVVITPVESIPTEASGKFRIVRTDLSQ